MEMLTGGLIPQFVGKEIILKYFVVHIVEHRKGMAWHFDGRSLNEYTRLSGCHFEHERVESANNERKTPLSNCSIKNNLNFL